jgi:hypothetical protein
MKMFVDDVREPKSLEWVWVRTYDEAVKLLRGNPVSVLSLDHDLGEGKSGYDIAKWLIEHRVWPQHIYCHSMNPVGRQNILSLLKHYAPSGTVVHNDIWKVF